MAEIDPGACIAHQWIGSPCPYCEIGRLKKQHRIWAATAREKWERLFGEYKAEAKATIERLEARIVLLDGPQESVLPPEPGVAREPDQETGSGD